MKNTINEIKYLNEKISSIKYNENRFNIFVGEDRYIVGVLSSTGQETSISNIMKFKTLYDTLTDLDWKIKLSLNNGIQYAYSHTTQNNFKISDISLEEEKLSYYFIENALFRTSSLWDMLAQLYCLHFSVQIRPDRIHYKQIFNPTLQHSDKFKQSAIKINQYINQNDNTDLNEEWEGNHAFVNEFRNKMTHRNSPNVTTISNYDLNFKSHPVFILKRVVEDYFTVSNYIDDILNDIEQKIHDKSN